MTRIKISMTSMKLPKSSNKKEAFFSFIRVFLSNLLVLVCSVLSGFIIPKIMGISDYGYYKTFSLYTTYVGMLHFGIISGEYLYFGGKNLDSLDKRKIHSITVFVFILEASISALMILFSCFLLDGNQRIIFIFVSIYSFFLNVQAQFSSILSATKNFRSESNISFAKTGLNILIILSIYCAYKFGNMAIKFYYYCLVSVFLLSFTTVCYIIRLKQFVFCKGQSTKETKSDLCIFFKLGFPMMIANLTSSLIMSVDSQFVSFIYPIESSNIFSEYSFAYSLLGFITTATSALSLVLFPYMRGKDENKLKTLFPDLNGIIIIFLGLSFLSYFFLEWFIPLFIPKYINSLPIFRAFLPALMLDSCVTIVTHSYYKLFSMELKFLLISLLSLIVTIVLDFAVYYLIILYFSPNNPVGFAYESVFSMIFWYLTSLAPLKKKIQIKHWKNDFFILCFIVIFYLESYFLPSLIGFLVYFVSAILLSVLFYSKNMIYIIQKMVFLVRKMYLRRIITHNLNLENKEGFKDEKRREN